jgi:hypothetical protein
MSKNFQTIEELLIDDSFWQYYFNHDQDAVLDWQDWYEGNAERTALVNEARQLLDKLSLKWSEEQIRVRLKELNFRLEQAEWDFENTSTQTNNTLDSKLEVAYKKPTNRFWWAVAAAVGVLIVSSLWFFDVPKDQNTEGWQEVVNTSQKAMLISLEDKTTVSLQANSRLRFPNHFAADKREVFLSGEAFFEVAKNPEKPLFVFAGEVVTQVLGTSFWIKKEERNSEGKRNIVVEVVTGRVSVFKKKQNEKSDYTEGVVLTPNLKATYIADNQLFVTGLVEKPILLPIQNEKVKQENPTFNFSFEDTPLSKVIEALENAYGIQIELVRESMLDCPFTANLNEVSLFEKLDLICGSLNAQYTVQGTTILIAGRGCQ